MFVAAVDDSEVSTPTRSKLGHLVGVGAVIFPEAGVAAYRDGMKELREMYGVPNDCELKWSPPRGHWLRGEGASARVEIQRRMIDLGVEVDARSITVVWDRAHCNRSVDDARKSVLQYLYDGISTYLRVLDSRNTGLVIADEPGGGPADQRRWLAETLRLTNNGTQWSKPDQVVLPILTAPSHHVPHIQLADLVCGATVGAVAGNSYAIDLLDNLKPLAARHATWDSIGGVGLKVWPPELGNLVHWLYGETEWGRGNVGLPLPWKDWLFADGDGMPVNPSPPSGPTS
jgi:hypothetical protein